MIDNTKICSDNT